MESATTIKKFGAKLCLFVALSLLVLPAALLAQSYDNPSIGQKPVARFPQDFKPLGIRAGAFMLHPGIQLAAQFNDNVFYTGTLEQNDTIWHVKPYITAQSNWTRHSLKIWVAADIARYNTFDILEYEDYFLSITGRVDVKERSDFSYGFDWWRLHEDRSNRFANEQGIKPTVFTLVGGNLGYDHTFNRFSIGVLWNIRDLDYRNGVTLAGEIIDNQDRDRTTNTFGARFGYWFKSDKQAFVAVNYYDTNFDQKFDRSGYERSGNGYNISGGLDFAMTGVLSGDVFLSYLDRSYDDPRLPNTNGWAVGMGLHWMPTTLTTVHGRITSSIEDTTLSTASGFQRTMYSVRVDHELLRNLQINGQVSYYDNKYQLLADAPENSSSSEHYFTAGVGATYFFNRWSYLSASYMYGKYTRGGNLDPRFDRFKVNDVWLVLGFER